MKHQYRCFTKRRLKKRFRNSRPRASYYWFKSNEEMILRIPGTCITSIQYSVLIAGWKII